MKNLLLLSTVGILSTAVAAGAAAAPPPATAAPDVLDALDFDNGAFLVEQSPSYASPPIKWSVWGLTDGSDDSGWCSAQGQPRGATYVWELDTTWRLDALALATTGLQEQSYPGVTVKTVELFVASTVGSADGGWKRLGTFDVGKDERRSHALPKNTLAARVKIVIAQNHGHAEYSELPRSISWARARGRHRWAKSTVTTRPTSAPCVSCRTAIRFSAATTGPTRARSFGARWGAGWPA